MIKRILLCIVLIFVLAWRFYQYFAFLPHYTNGQLFSIQVVLQADPVLTNQGQSFSIKDRYNQTIFVSTSSFPRFHAGQVIGITGKMQVKTNPDGRVLYSLYAARVAVNAEAENVFAETATKIRNWSADLYATVLPSRSASLLMGIVFGSKEQFSDDFYADLQATGVLHVIAASGMNVTFVAAALIGILGILFQRQVALVLACLGILFYVVLVGFQPSIIRAALMGMLGFGASILGRQQLALVAVCVSAYLMLVWQPGYLFDVGFQLSFMATLGILYLKPLIPIPENIWTEAITTTTAAQLGTLPILFGVFGKIGLFSLLVNACTLWTVPILMTLGSSAVVVGIVAQPIAYVLLYLALPFLLFFEQMVIFFGSMGGVLHLPTFPLSFAAAYYLLLTAAVIRKGRTNTSPQQESHSHELC